MKKMKLSLLPIVIVVISVINAAFAIFAIDLSTSKSIDTFRCTRKLGYERVTIRGYFEAYGGNPGGRNFLQNYYKNAKAAGYTYIDVYMFPCIGRPTCKTSQEQVNDLIQLISANQLIIQMIWLDVEVDEESHNW